jgi:hypothetical protein
MGMPEAWGWEEEEAVCFQRVLRWPCLVPISRPVAVRSISTKHSPWVTACRPRKRFRDRWCSGDGLVAGSDMALDSSALPCQVGGALRAHGMRLECMCPRRRQRCPLRPRIACSTVNSYARKRLRDSGLRGDEQPIGVTCATWHLVDANRSYRDSSKLRWPRKGKRIRSGHAINMLARIVRSDSWRQLLASMNDLDAGVVGVHAAEPQGHDGLCGTASEVLHQVGGLLELLGRVWPSYGLPGKLSPSALASRLG